MNQKKKLAYLERWGWDLFYSPSVWSEPLDLNKNKIWCWLVIDVRNSEISINVICKLLIPNLSKSKISVYRYMGGRHILEEVRSLLFWMICRWHVEEGIRHQEERLRLLFKMKPRESATSHKYNSKDERTKRMPDNCYLSRVMCGDGCLNSRQDICRRPWKMRFFLQVNYNFKGSNMWLTWLVRWRNRCGLQSKNWYRGRV